MKALDTNVLARFFVDDPDDAQAAKQRPYALQALAQRCFVPITVVLELEWVLRGFYELGPKDVARVLHALVSIEHITVERRDAVLSATQAMAAGLDFADAMHMALSDRAAAFVTFDSQLAKRARKAQLSPAVLRLG
jgi:predicted nucleic-acid-binding protein